MGQFKNEQRQRVNWLLRRFRDHDPARLTAIFTEAAAQLENDPNPEACVLDYLENAIDLAYPS